MNSVRMMIRWPGPKCDPKVFLAILNIDGDSIEGAVFRLDLIANIGIEHFQAGVRTAILAGELPEKRDPLILSQLDHFPGGCRVSVCHIQNLLADGYTNGGTCVRRSVPGPQPETQCDEKHAEGQ